MTELYPVVRGGRVEALQGGAAEATVLYDPETLEPRVYFWLSPRRAVEVTRFLDERGNLRVGEVTLPVRLWLVSAPYIHAYTVEDAEEQAERLARLVGRDLRGRRVVLGFSGGKDSLAALLVLLRLRERIPFRLDVMYIHVPYLESPRNTRFVEEVSRRLGVDIEIVEPPRKKMRSYLLWRGLPRRGDRWCTFFKVKPMREYKKRHRGALEVVADRLTEAPKRLEKLAAPASRHEYISGRKFRPTYLLTLLDVVRIVRRAGLIHPAYLDGLPRVACTLCPFKALHEFTVVEELEDPGFIEAVLRKEHRKWYQEIPFEDFVEQRLWRYPRREALQVYRAKKLLEELAEREGLPEMSAEEAAANYRSVWVEPLPEAPRLNPPDVAAKALSQRIIYPRRRIPASSNAG